MEIRIRTTDYHMTQEVAAYLNERLRSLEKFLDAEIMESARCEVEIGRAAGRPRHGANIYFAEIQVIYPGEERFIRATNNSESINGAIDDAKDEVLRQLRREKKLHIRVARRAGAFAKGMMRFGN
jgi:ribosomal subunit interface protein